MHSAATASTQNPHRSVYDEKHYAVRIYFYFNDYQNEKAAETACYEYRNSDTKTSLAEVYRDRRENGYYFFLPRA